MSFPFFKRHRFHFLVEPARVVFRVSIVTSFLLLAVEYLLPGFVANWFNPLWVLLLAAGSGILSQAEQSR